MTRDLGGESNDDLYTTFVKQRQVLLRHTAAVLSLEDPDVRQISTEREAKLSAILVSSLEELKVAEEELAERAESVATLRAEMESRLRDERALFDFAPVSLLVTDSYGNILEANRACAALFRRDIAQLEGQPIARFVRPDDRRAFRDGLNRIAETETDGVTDWQFVLVRPTDAALEVSAAVRAVKPVGGISGVRLFWSLRVAGTIPQTMTA